MIIYVEGNIGSGKSTFCNLLSEYFGLEMEAESNIILEPVNEWLTIVDENGDSLLDNFYKNQEKWSFAFQLNCFISRINKIENSKNGSNGENGEDSKIYFIERSVFTDKYCFALNCYESGKMNKIEYDIYCKWHEWLVDKFDVMPDAYIYLRTSPEISFERMKKRSRGGEEEVPLDYLKLLHNKHEEWMEIERKNNVKVITIDVTDDFNNEKIMKNIINKIKNELGVGVGVGVW